MTVLAPDPQRVYRWLMQPGETGVVTLADLIRRPAWMADGACQGEPPETFFPEVGGNLSRARELCSGCPVRQECLEYAMADPDLAGFWGGTSSKERDRLRRVRPEAPRT